MGANSPRVFKNCRKYEKPTLLCQKMKTVFSLKCFMLISWCCLAEKIMCRSLVDPQRGTGDIFLQFLVGQNDQINALASKLLQFASPSWFHFCRSTAVVFKPNKARRPYPCILDFGHTFLLLLVWFYCIYVVVKWLGGIIST